MKWTLITLLSLFSCALAGVSGKINAAVVPATPGLFSRAELDYLGSQVETGLLYSKEYRVLERAQMGDILAEHGFQNSGVCQQDSCGVEFGKLLGVEKIIILSVAKEGGAIAVSAKLVDVATGTIEKTENIRSYGTISQVAVQKGQSLGRKLVGVNLEEDQPAYKQKKLWITLGAAAILIPVVFFATRSETTTETVERKVRFQ